MRVGLELGDNSDLDAGVERRMGAERAASARMKRWAWHREQRYISELGGEGSFSVLGWAPVAPQQDARAAASIRAMMIADGISPEEADEAIARSAENKSRRD